MAYRRDPKVYKLVFDDTTDFAGLEVRAKSVDLGTLLKLSGIANQARLDSDEVDELLSGFARALVSWNVEDENGNPVPATKEGMYSGDPHESIAIVRKWIDVMSNPPDDLGKDSGSGENSPEAQLPMETSSESPES
jgi:hypothetical protein